MVTDEFAPIAMTLDTVVVKVVGLDVRVAVGDVDRAAVGEGVGFDVERRRRRLGVDGPAVGEACRLDTEGIVPVTVCRLRRR